uniref:Uncharacterized protein n=1 Tax=Laticauda laticaudata TaxID=8630 RepID=A0A8C5R940_LATLA
MRKNKAKRQYFSGICLEGQILFQVSPLTTIPQPQLSCSFPFSLHLFLGLSGHPVLLSVERLAFSGCGCSILESPLLEQSNDDGDDVKRKENADILVRCLA